MEDLSNEYSDDISDWVAGKAFPDYESMANMVTGMGEITDRDDVADEMAIRKVLEPDNYHRPYDMEEVDREFFQTHGGLYFWVWDDYASFETERLPLESLVAHHDGKYWNAGTEHNPDVDVLCYYIYHQLFPETNNSLKDEIVLYIDYGKVKNTDQYFKGTGRLIYDTAPVSPSVIDHIFSDFTKLDEEEGDWKVYYLTPRAFSPLLNWLNPKVLEKVVEG
jgi:hypothetical protein